MVSVNKSISMKLEDAPVFAEFEALAKKSFGDIVKVAEHNVADSDCLLISYGSPVNSCLGAMEMAENLHIGVLQLVTIWPFADKQMQQAIKNKTRALHISPRSYQKIY